MATFWKSGTAIILHRTMLKSHRPLIAIALNQVPIRRLQRRAVAERDRLVRGSISRIDLPVGGKFQPFVTLSRTSAVVYERSASETCR